jgi:Mannosyltransferase (PIG-V)
VIAAARRHFVLVVWALSCGFYLAVGALGHAFLEHADVVVSNREPPGVLNYWAHWDGAYFTYIAEHGYRSAEATAFFPFYPLLIRAVGVVGAGPALVGVVISVAATLVALFFFHGLTAHLRDERVARVATVALAFFPTAFFLVADYSEALFLALSAGCLWALYVRGDFLAAGAFGYFAAVTRSVGVALVIPLAWEWLRRRRGLRWESLLGVAAPVIGLATYSFYLWRVARQPLLFNTVYEKSWGRKLHDPVSTLHQGWSHGDDGLAYLVHWDRVFGTSSLNPPFLLSNTVNLVCAAVLLGLLVVGIFTLPRGLALYSIPIALAPVSLPAPGLPLVSLPRYLLAALPLFIVLGLLLARSRVVLAVWLALSLALGVLLTLEFVTWRWVA